MLFRARVDAGKAKDAFVVKDVRFLAFLGDDAYIHGADVGAVAAVGAGCRFLSNPYEPDGLVNPHQCQHGTEKTEKPAFEKRPDQRQRQHNHGQSGHHQGRFVEMKCRDMQPVAFEYRQQGLARADLTEGKIKVPAELSDKRDRIGDKNGYSNGQKQQNILDRPDIFPGVPSEPGVTHADERPQLAQYILDRAKGAHPPAPEPIENEKKQGKQKKTLEHRPSPHAQVVFEAKISEFPLERHQVASARATGYIGTCECRQQIPCAACIVEIRLRQKRVQIHVKSSAVYEQDEEEELKDETDLSNLHVVFY
jgi:hypothetical protein